MQRAFTALTISAAIGFTGAASAQTLKKVQDRGMLVCGVSQGLAGFSTPDDRGNWSGLRCGRANAGPRRG